MTASHRSEDQPDEQTGHERTSGRAGTQIKGEPPKGVSQRAHCDRPSKHSQRRREKYAEGSSSDASRDDIEPQRDGSAWFVHGQTYTEKSEPNQKSDGDRQNYKAKENEATDAKAHSGVDQIYHALERVWPWNQNHARTNSNQTQR